MPSGEIYNELNEILELKTHHWIHKTTDQ